jgi:uncharacterized Zn finger protein (UPF0148 family)
MNWSDLTSFLEYLEELAQKLPRAQASSDIIGNIEFTHCPACLAVLTGDKGVGHCVICGAETDPERERSRYLQIKMDLDIQIRESRQLLDEKQRASTQFDRELRRLRRDLLSSPTSARLLRRALSPNAISGSAKSIGMEGN